MQTPSFKGHKDLQTQSSDFNTASFHIRQEISKLDTVKVVEIVAVNVEARISPVGYVDVKPLVDQMDGRGESVPHGIIYNVPYMRMQGGVNAFIIDPQVGDIGICCFADRDISRLKETKASSLPGTKRMMSMADGLYVGGVLNETPERYIIIEDDGIEINGVQLVKIVADEVSVECSDASIVADSVLIDTVEADIIAETITVDSTTTTLTSPTVDITASASLTVTSPVMTFTGATSISLITPLLNLTALVVTNTGVISALDFATTTPGAVIPSMLAHIHEQGNDSNGDSEVPTDPPTYT